jgi:peptidoglycan-associated lipoprotein
MQKNTILKLGMTALLSVMLVACQSNDTADTSGTSPPPPAASTSGANNTGGLSPAELERQRIALAQKVFYFEYDSSELSAEDRDALVYHAADLKANSSKRIRLEGHADERGTREYNLALGERRAQAIERYLQVQGVAASQMETISYGEEMPAETATGEAAYSRNRRVEIK